MSLLSTSTSCWEGGIKEEGDEEGGGREGGTKEGEKVLCIVGLNITIYNLQVHA